FDSDSPMPRLAPVISQVAMDALQTGGGIHSRQAGTADMAWGGSGTDRPTGAMVGVSADAQANVRTSVCAVRSLLHAPTPTLPRARGRGLSAAAVARRHGDLAWARRCSSPRLRGEAGRGRSRSRRGRACPPPHPPPPRGGGGGGRGGGAAGRGGRGGAAPRRPPPGGGGRGGGGPEGAGVVGRRGGGPGGGRGLWRGRGAAPPAGGGGGRGGGAPDRAAARDAPTPTLPRKRGRESALRCVLLRGAAGVAVGRSGIAAQVVGVGRIRAQRATAFQRCPFGQDAVGRAALLHPVH